MICVLVAHKAEANAIIEYFKLEKISNNFFQFASLSVLVTGQGRDNVKQTIMRHREILLNMHIIVNFGIAGHKSCAIGQLVSICCLQLEDRAISIEYCKHCSDKLSMPLHKLTSIYNPTHYAENIVQDMEFAAIYQSMLQISCNARLMSVKLISDNACYPVDTLTKKRIMDLLENASLTLVKFLDCVVQ